MKLHITPEKFEELIKKSYSLDIIYLLKLIEAEHDVQPLYENSMRISAIYQSLRRKGLIAEDENKLDNCRGSGWNKQLQLRMRMSWTDKGE